MFHRGGGQCWFKANATDPYVPARKSGCAYGKEHHDAQGNPWSLGKQLCPGEVSKSFLYALVETKKKIQFLTSFFVFQAFASHKGECGLCFH